MADEGINEAQVVAQVELGIRANSLIRRPDDAIGSDSPFDAFLLRLASAALKKLKDHETRKKHFVHGARLKPGNGGRVASHNVYHDVRVEEQHRRLTLTALGLFTELTRVAGAVANIRAVFPQADQVGSE